MRIIAARFAALSLLVTLGAATLSFAAEAADQAGQTGLLDKLVASYPDFLASHDGNTLRWKDGTAMPFDDSIVTLLPSPLTMIFSHGPVNA